tara:strand:+ start:304 stop:417 length:114 start_codon:yes stop_codon:yes gene_type:complete
MENIFVRIKIKKSMPEFSCVEKYFLYFLHANYDSPMI